jgi:salicylate hydroxylase
VIVTGECAGGGLAIALAVALRDSGERQPTAIYACSPFCDLTISPRGFDFETSSDPWLDSVFATQLAACAVQDNDPATPLLSPLFADLRGLPPLLLHAAREEAMLPSAQGLAENARERGVAAVLEEFEDSVHSFVLFDYLPETTAAIAQFAQFAASVRRD